MTLIKRADAIKAVCNAQCELDVPHYPQCDQVKYYDDIQALLALPSAEAEWIPCSERLPKEEEETYWVCTDTEYQCECRWTNNRFGLGEGEWGWSIFDTPQYSKPIAWMPLPKPYREDGEA